MTRWQIRRAKVDALLAATKATRESHAADADAGADAALAAGIGKTFAELKLIKGDYEQTLDAEKRRKAIETITTTLHLTTEAFIQLVTVLDTTSSLDPLQWQEVYNILTQAQKTATFPTWIAEETGDAITLGPKDFWVSLTEPKGLPKWLSAKEARQAWQLALTRRSQSSIIDPDLVPANHLVDPLTGPARMRWKERYEAISQLMKDYTDQLNAVQLAAGDELALFNRITEEALGIPTTGLIELEATRSGGRVIDKELAQLTLGDGPFNYLLKVFHLLEQANQAARLRMAGCLLDSDPGVERTAVCSLARRREPGRHHPFAGSFPVASPVSNSPPATTPNTATGVAGNSACSTGLARQTRYSDGYRTRRLRGCFRCDRYYGRSYTGNTP